MATDREARALGAGMYIEVDGKKYTLNPVTVKQLCEIERESLACFKREYMRTWNDNIDLLGGNKLQLLTQKLNEVAQWGVSDLPSKSVYDATNINVTPELKKWLEQEFAIPLENDGICRILTSMALDQERINPEKVKELTGTRPIQGKVRYDQWWVTATMEGMSHLVHAAISNELTYEEISSWPYEKLAEASRMTEKITAAEMGNG